MHFRLSNRSRLPLRVISASHAHATLQILAVYCLSRPLFYYVLLSNCYFIFSRFIFLFLFLFTIVVLSRVTFTTNRNIGISSSPTIKINRALCILTLSTLSYALPPCHIWCHKFIIRTCSHSVSSHRR